MALTGKTIGQLTQLSNITTDTLFPVELSGETYHIAYSAFTNLNYITGTYNELYSYYTGGTLTAGSYYLMTDYQTCYDQPNFDYNGNPITTGNYKSGSTEPLLLLAIATNTFSPTVYSTIHPKDKITYDITWNTTEVTNNPAKGRIIERIDEYNNRTDYDHRAILFKRYKSYFQDGSISGRIIEMNNGVVTGLNTNFTSDLSTGSTIWIMSQNPELYEVISIESTSGMTVSGFNYQNFSDPVGFECEVMIPSNLEPIYGTLYYFNDVGSNNIGDGGDDMYDGGNKIYTNLFSEIPYTHTQMTDPPINGNNPATFGDFVYNGTVQSGDTYFNSGSTYFTNCYPGLFVMSAYDINITDFEIDGNLGSDGDGQADTYDYTLTFSGTDYSVYCKRVWDAQDPSVNHIYIVNTIDENITHNIDIATEDDLDTISNLTGVTQIHYLLFALAGGAKATNTQIQNVVNSYLSFIDPSDINTTLSSLNSNFTGITSNLPANQSGYKSLNVKQTNLTGDTESFVEYLTFGEPSENIINNYIGNYANTYGWDNNTFILSNNVFYGNLEYVNNTFGNSCFNNTFDDDCTNNIIGNFFYNNTTDDDFDSNLIGNFFYNNYITSNFQRNRIGDEFNNNTIITGSFYRNQIGNQFNNNVITNGDFQNNEIGNAFNNNIIESQFYKNDIENGFNNNRIYSNFYGNLIGGGYNNNRNYSSFQENFIGEIFDGNILGNPLSFGSYNFRNNRIGNNFLSNNCSGDTQSNVIGNNFINNNLDTNFSFNQIGSEFTDNIISNDFGFGGSTYRGNIIGNGFKFNTVGEYCYDNTFGDNCTNNNLSDYFTNNKVSYGFNNVIINNLDTLGTPFQNNNFTYGNFSQNLTLTGGIGGNPVFYSSIPTNVTLDYVDSNGYVTFLSGGTFTAQNVIV